MTGVHQTARGHSVWDAAGVMVVVLMVVLALLILGYGSAIVYDSWREVLNKHGRLMYVMSLDGIVVLAVAMVSILVGISIGVRVGRR